LLVQECLEPQFQNRFGGIGPNYWIPRCLRININQLDLHRKRHGEFDQKKKLSLLFWFEKEKEKKKGVL